MPINDPRHSSEQQIIGEQHRAVITERCEDSTTSYRRSSPSLLLNENRPNAAAEIETTSNESATDTVSALQCTPTFRETDATIRLVNAFERTISALRDSSLNEGKALFVNRMTTAKDLPHFSGDPLEWLQFKEAYELSSELGQYGDRGKIARLLTALKGEARDIVSTLLATSRDPAIIMRTLELHYGSKKIIAEKIFADLQSLPDLYSGKINLVRFATKLKNATTAFKSFKLTGYLYSPDLIKSIGNKLPSALKYAYNRQSATMCEEKSDLEKLRDFLYTEAELANAAGLFNNDDCAFETRKTVAPRREEKQVFKRVYTPRLGPPSEYKRKNLDNRACVICERGAHSPPQCALFVRETVDRRWNLAKKYSLCYGCLLPGHARVNCSGEKCKYCERYHALLHNNQTENRDCTRSSGRISQSSNTPTDTIQD